MNQDNQTGWATLSLKTAEGSIARKYTLSVTDKTVIGRSPDCQISLNPHKFITVSRRHAELKLADANWQITDLRTTNGTLINDLPIDRPQQLKSGDRITLGTKGPEFVFECLTLKATVMVQTTQMKADEPAKKAPTSVSPKAEAKAKQTIPASPPVQSEPPVTPLQSEVKEFSTPEIVNTSRSPAENIDFNVSSVIPGDSLPKVTSNQVSDTSKNLWNLICARELCQMPGHGQPLLALAFSPDGQILATTAKDKTIKLWNLADQTEITTLTGHKLAANAVVFSRDGTILASAGANKTIKLWDLANQTEITSFGGHKLAINALAYSPDGQTIASGSADKTIKLWNLANQTETGSFAGHKLAIESLAFSPDGQTIASGSKDKTIKLWNVDSKEEQGALVGHKQAISTISFSPDGQTIASAGADRTIRLWKRATQSEIAAIATPSWQTGAIALANDGKTLAGVDEQNIIRLWQI